MDVSWNIKAIRAKKGITQAEIAKQIGVERTNYHRLENRGSKLTIEQLQQIAQALNVTIVELLTWGEEVEPEDKSYTDIKSLKTRLKELEKQISLYDENRAYRARQDKTQASIFYHLIDNIIWDIAYNYNIISQEEAEKHRVVVATTVKLWMVEGFWGDENGEHPYAVNLLTENQLNQALDVLFSLVWARKIISQILYDDWLNSKLSEWEDEGGENGLPGKNVFKVFYTYKGEAPELQ